VNRPRGKTGRARALPRLYHLERSPLRRPVARIVGGHDLDCVHTVEELPRDVGEPVVLGVAGECPLTTVHSQPHVGQYLQGVNFPAQKEEVASNAESNGAPQDLVQQIRNSGQATFNSADEVLHTVQGK
jgi:hypothetical protein